MDDESEAQNAPEMLGDFLGLNGFLDEDADLDDDLLGYDSDDGVDLGVGDDDDDDDDDDDGGGGNYGDDDDDDDDDDAGAGAGAGSRSKKRKTRSKKKIFATVRGGRIVGATMEDATAKAEVS